MKEPWLKLIGETCWHVSVGGVTSPSFMLVFGEKIRRQRVLSNNKQPLIYRENRGSVELLVWCSWRLQSPDSVLATSDQDEAGVIELRKLRTAVVDTVECHPPAWDLSIGLRDGRSLILFCDHFDPGASIGQNWELWIPGMIVSAGPGSKFECEKSSQRI